MKRLAIGIAVVLFLFALPLWSRVANSAPDFLEALQELLEKDNWSQEEIREIIKQEVDWGQAQVKDAEMVALCLEYAKDVEEQIGPYEQAQLAKEVAVMAQEMRAFGFGEAMIVRTALNGTREVLGEMFRLRQGEESETGTGDLIRTRLRENLQTASLQETRQMVKIRNQEQKNSRPDDLLVSPGPQGSPSSGPQGSPGKANPNK